MNIFYIMQRNISLDKKMNQLYSFVKLQWKRNAKIKVELNLMPHQQFTSTTTEFLFLISSVKESLDSCFQWMFLHDWKNNDDSPVSSSYWTERNIWQTIIWGLCEINEVIGFIFSSFVVEGSYGDQFAGFTDLLLKIVLF